jgi:DnaJ family protein C protein 19
LTKILFLAAFIVAAWWFTRTAKINKPSMQRDEAARLLGISIDADQAAINEAYRRLIARVHPDAGGNAELAARINLARDTMLKQLKC